MIPTYPNFAPVSLDMREEIHPHFLRLTSGVSEFSFSNIFLFRRTYDYRISKLSDSFYVLEGTKQGHLFFALPWGLPNPEVLSELFATHAYWKNAVPAQLEEYKDVIAQLQLEVKEDRDNWDYLYDSTEMATLEGKRFHKKKNHVNAFFAEHPEGFEGHPMTSSEEDTRQAMQVLDQWQALRNEPGDYIASKEAIELRDVLGFSGHIWTLNQIPVGYAQGEALQQDKTFAIHFEKADGTHKGIYQSIFYNWADELKNKYPFINREQDLGEPGLRQAKETYRPVDFIRKYQLWPSTKM